MVPGGYMVLGGALFRGVHGPGGGVWWRSPSTATAAGGTHPTGMHSCVVKEFVKQSFIYALFLLFVSMQYR